MNETGLVGSEGEDMDGRRIHGGTPAMACVAGAFGILWDADRR